MIYGGDIMSNFSGSIMSNDKEMQKDILLSEIHKILDKNPKSLIYALKNSGVDVPSDISKKHLIHLVVEAVYENTKFRENIAFLIAQNQHSNFSNANGELVDKIKAFFAKSGDGSSDSTAEGAGGKILGGAASGGVVGAVSGAVNSIFGFAKSKTDAKTQKEADKQKLILALTQEEETKKSNLMPIIIIATVLLIGGAIAVVSLRNKK
jgi:hypothetical protein